MATSDRADTGDNSSVCDEIRPLGQMWYIIARQVSSPDADRSIKHLRDLGIEFIDADWTLAHSAAYFKSRNKMSFADAFAAALAKDRKAQLITGDQEFRQVEQDIAIKWL